MAANNAGYMYYKLDRFDEAVRWVEKAITLDPKRAIAYVNLGDAYYESNRIAEARRYYERYLELDPNGYRSAAVRARIGK